MTASVNFKIKLIDCINNTVSFNYITFFSLNIKFNIKVNISRTQLTKLYS